MCRQKLRVSAIAVFAALALLGGCEKPIRDSVQLMEIKAEAQVLLKANPLSAEISKSTWPRAIASLEPEFVSINPDGVHITMRAYFDGGWGYFVPRKERDAPEPAIFEEVGPGIYWWHPY